MLAVQAQDATQFAQPPPQEVRATCLQPFLSMKGYPADSCRPGTVNGLLVRSAGHKVQLIIPAVLLRLLRHAGAHEAGRGAQQQAPTKVQDKVLNLSMLVVLLHMCKACHGHCLHLQDDLAEQYIEISGWLQAWLAAATRGGLSAWN